MSAELPCQHPGQRTVPAERRGRQSYDIVVIAGSAGGIEALIDLLSLLPADFSLPIVIVQHLSQTWPSCLPEVLSWRSCLTVKWAEDGGSLAPGFVYVAPRGRHVTLTEAGRFRLLESGRINFVRPSADPLFESAAALFGARTIAVVLSGMMRDGAAGVAAVVAAGGIAIAQDELSSGFFDMPSAAIDFGGADAVLTPAGIAEALTVLANVA